MEGTLAQAVGSYRERPVAGHLRDVFTCVWVHRLPATASSPIVVVPDGCIDLQVVNGTLRIAGPDREPQKETVPTGKTVIGFRFRPGAATAWLGVPAHEIVDRRVALDELWGARAVRDLATIGGDGLDAHTLVPALEQALGRCGAVRGPRDDHMGVAFDLLSVGLPHGTPVVPWLAGHLSLSERTLRRRFDDAFGYGPKTLDRILQYQRFLGLMRRGGGLSGAALAAEAGYSDQAHLVRESRRLTGSTPGEVAKLLAS